MNNALYMVWNPSEGFDLGFITLRFYSLMFVVAFGLGWYVMKGIYNREGQSIEKLDNLFVYTVVATLVGARLGHVFFYDWAYFKNHLLEILLPMRETADGWEFTGFAGLASHGAAIAIIIVMYFYSKKVVQKPILWVLDRIVLPVASGAIFVRLGNFFNSEIVGTETTSSFGIRFIRDKFTPREAFEKTNISDINDAYKAIETNPQFADVLAEVTPKHPAMLYEAFGYVFVFAILLYMYWKTDARNKQGLLFGTFLVLLWTVRFIVEYVKESQGGFEESLGLLSTGQWLSIPFIIVGFYFIFRTKKVA
ncbi:prolipoprotein diacylglyceryl transferase [uncultured Flavobacterium sp.]|uniref:prolipoprotein diacylglyceryl transferase n=1 Tax=uncultured Flavobacterium sp. TaxID=165435 RepID=UPI0030C89460